MRFVLVTALLLGGLAACGGPSENAPPPTIAATPPPAPAAPPPAPPPGFDGHYVGTAAGTGGRGCAREQNFDINVANNTVSGTVTMQGRGGATATSDLSGHVGPNGKAVIRMAGAGGRGSVIGKFADGQFTGREGAPCRRQLTASRQ